MFQYILSTFQMWALSVYDAYVELYWNLQSIYGILPKCLLSTLMLQHLRGMEKKNKKLSTYEMIRTEFVDSLDATFK